MVKRGVKSELRARDAQTGFISRVMRGLSKISRLFSISNLSIRKARSWSELIIAFVPVVVDEVARNPFRMWQESDQSNCHSGRVTAFIYGKFPCPVT